MDWEGWREIWDREAVAGKQERWWWLTWGRAGGEEKGLGLAEGVAEEHQCQTLGGRVDGGPLHQNRWYKKAAGSVWDKVLAAGGPSTVGGLGTTVWGLPCWV